MMTKNTTGAKFEKHISRMLAKVPEESLEKVKNGKGVKRMGFWLVELQ